jgi:hypothetical protein
MRSSTASRSEPKVSAANTGFARLPANSYQSQSDSHRTDPWTCLENLVGIEVSHPQISGTREEALACCSRGTGRHFSLLVAESASCVEASHQPLNFRYQILWDVFGSFTVVFHRVDGPYQTTHRVGEI